MAATLILRRESDHFDMTVKIMLLGDSCTGKTCLLMRFKDSTFLNSNFISTVGIDYRNKTVDIDGMKVKLQVRNCAKHILFKIWDTAGQERFRSVTHSYYRDADALMLIFDLTNRRSFDNVRGWLSEIREYASARAQLILVGNKVDLSNSQRMVTQKEARKLAEENGIDYVETSAKTGEKVNESFVQITRCLIRQHSKLSKNKDNERVVLDEANATSNYWWQPGCANCYR